ncbi:MAG TPA: hypothetical protein VLA42_18215 [Verrucomicrobiae bacterium]|jgi:DNA-binding cell septation regulator SpoVG|nr:hypothetical protein [Verrucomicrobiae bacterium]
MFQINVEDIRQRTQRHILASCTVRLSTENEDEFITIFDVRVLKNRSGEKWIGYPTQQTRDVEGIKYVPDMDFSRNLRNRISEIVLKEYDKNDAYYDVTGAVRPAVPAARGVPFKRIEAADRRASFQFTGHNINSGHEANRPNEANDQTQDKAVGNGR